MSEHVILVAFTVEAESRDKAEAALLPHLPQPSPLGPVTPYRATERLTSWWVAEDDRHDGSDLDSAVFVHPGAQKQAAALLRGAGLTNDCNLWDEGREVRGQFEVEDVVSDVSVVDSIATMLGTSPEWDGAADYLESIANLIGLVRPHPGDYVPADYRRDFKAATGRDVNAAFDCGDDV